MPAANKHVTTFTTPTDTDVVVTRVFNAPRHLVFEAHTSCKHIPNWMGPYGWTMSECRNDLKPGGEFRYTWSKPGDSGITITGTNKEVDPPSRIVSTESWGEPWPHSTNTMEFTEQDGQTTLVMTIRYPSKEARDMALGTGMKDGMTVGYERLDEYLGRFDYSIIRLFEYSLTPNPPAMIDEPTILQTTAQKAAVIRLTIPRNKIQEVMGPGHQELMSTLKSQGLTPTGPWFSHHFRMDPAVFDFEIGVPVSGDVKPQGRVKPGSLPAARVARTTYRGGYEGLGSAWGEFNAWLEARGHGTVGDLWEVYTAGPETGNDASLYRTELNRPIRD